MGCGLLLIREVLGECIYLRCVSFCMKGELCWVCDVAGYPKESLQGGDLGSGRGCAWGSVIWVCFGCFLR